MINAEYKIGINDLFRLEDPKNWTICLNNDIKDTDVCSLLDPNVSEEKKNRLIEHISWKQSTDAKHAFRIINTPYCLQFLRIEGSADRWLFLGSFDRKGEKIYKGKGEGVIYDLCRRNDSLVKYSERLIVRYKKKQGPKGAKINWDEFMTMEVIELLPDIYNSVNTPFPGYDNVCLTFSKMKTIFSTPFRNWQEALSIVNGIYVITNTKEGKLYVGSTYNSEGVWQRWSEYVNTNGSGGDIKLEELLQKEGDDYAEKYFQFTLLEIFPNTAKTRLNETLIINRETYWKKALKAREESLGYNKN